jgi:hypothetical protein
MHEGTTSEETVEISSYSKKHFFMVKFPEVLGSTTYIGRCNCKETGKANKNVSDWNV